jgi:hypothetical protein
VARSKKGKINGSGEGRLVAMIEVVECSSCAWRGGRRGVCEWETSKVGMEEMG